MLSWIRNFIDNRSGAVAVAFGLAIPVMVSAVGVAVDIGQSYLVRERLSRALDAAALAAAAMGTDDTARIEAKLNDFMDANYPSDKIGYTVDLQVLPAEGDDLRVSASAQLDTAFMNIFGMPHVLVEVETTVQREVRGVEVGLVLDVTGSMAGANIASLRTATLSFIDIIFDRVDDPDDLRVALIPYSASVNVGSIAPQIVDDLPEFPPGTERLYTADDNNTTTADDLNWRGCVRARATPNDVEDNDLATGGLFEPFWWNATLTDANDNRWWQDANSNGVYNGVSENRVSFQYTNYADMTNNNSDCNNARTPNLGCPEHNPIVPLTSNESVLATAAGRLKHWCRGGTFGNQGMIWGWHVLSPTLPFDQGAAYDNPLWKKFVIMMTDGDNQFFDKPSTPGSTSDDTSYGRLSEGVLGTTNLAAARTVLNERFEEICESMKDEGITIYTITFASSINDTTRGYYERCATDETKYHNAPTGADLVSVFEDIAREISNLHITQ